MEFNDNKPIFRQIADMAIAKVIAGDWQPGSRIPSAREMAVEMAVNLHTVLKAYDQLERDEIIVSRRGMGFFVADGAQQRAATNRRDEFFKEKLTDIFIEMQRLGITPEELIEAYRHFNKD